MQDLRAALPDSRSSILALDLETNGTDPTDPDFRIIGIGLADEGGVWYFDWQALNFITRSYLYAQLKRRPLTAFNVGFDGLVLWAAGLGWLSWSMCSYALFKQMSTEGYEGQRWNLEVLERDVLGWTVSNKKRLGELLSKHGLSKDQMWQLAVLEPAEFGQYCAEDAEAALQGFEELSKATYDFGDAGARLRQYHTEDFLTEVKVLCEQQLRGLMVDVPKLEQYRIELNEKIEGATKDFLSHPDVAPHAEAYDRAARDKVHLAEPPKFKKNGTVSLRWQNWYVRAQLAVNSGYFNINSTLQLAWLFYERLGYTPIKFTGAGAPSMGKEVLPMLGEPGKLLSIVKKLTKELMYVDATLAKQRNGLLHLQYKTIGALSTRLSGGTDE